MIHCNIKIHQARVSSLEYDTFLRALWSSESARVWYWTPECQQMLAILSKPQTTFSGCKDPPSRTVNLVQESKELKDSPKEYLCFGQIKREN